jgi:hypothetical protein
MHADAGQGIERGERFVQKHEFRLLHQGARQGDALGLPTGQIARPVIEAVAKSDLGQRRAGALARVRCHKAKGHVAPKAVPWQQPMFLEDDGRPARCHNASPLDRIESGQRSQQRGLSASAFTEQCDEFSALDEKIELVDDDPIAVSAPEIGYRNGRRGVRRRR